MSDAPFAQIRHLDDAYAVRIQHHVRRQRARHDQDEPKSAERWSAGM